MKPDLARIASEFNSCVVLSEFPHLLRHFKHILTTKYLNERESLPVGVGGSTLIKKYEINMGGGPCYARIFFDHVTNALILCNRKIALIKWFSLGPQNQKRQLLHTRGKGTM